MRKNLNLTPTFGYIPKFADGTVICCQVDQFPVKDLSLFKENGFPRSDIGIIDRMNASDVDPDLVKQISARMMDTSCRSPYDGMSDEEMLKVLRPAYVQTATEVKFFEESVYQFIKEKSDSLKKTNDSTVSVDSVDNVSSDNENV